MRYLIPASVLFAVLLAGCGARQSTPNAEGNTGVFRSYSERDVGAKEYRVAPPDKLVIKSPGIKEMNDITSTIRPDGKISVNLLGEVYVANKTPEEIGKMLTDLATKYYNNPEVKVEVAEFNSKFYSVIGVPVRDPGKKPFTGRDTVIDALTAAGFLQDAWPQQVSLSRPGKAGQQNATAIIDFKKMAMTGDVKQNYLLEEGDVIYVPNSPLAQWRIDSNNVFGPLGQGAGTASAVQGVGPVKK